MPDDTPSPGPTDEVLGPSVWVRQADLAFTFVRGQGPGGQSVNKLASAAQLRVPVAAIVGLGDTAVTRLRRLAGQRLIEGDVLLIQSRTHRSQLDNRRACIERLRNLVITAQRVPKPRRKTRPTRAMIRRRLVEKKQHSEKKQRRREGRNPRDE